MVRGLVLGKFYPLHKGHIALIAFAEQRCDELIVLVCASDQEKINGALRLQWIKDTFASQPKVRAVLLEYKENDLPNTSVSSPEVSKIWASYIAKNLPPIDTIFTSEPYGDYLADFLHCTHISFDPGRKMMPISATVIRNNIFSRWEDVAEAARPFFVKKICLGGTESTGKSVLTEKLAAHYKTTYVPEMARDIIETTTECTALHLQQIATLHAATILEKIKTANRLLFADTDLSITKSYSRFLFNTTLVIKSWVEEANRFDLYLYLANDAPYIQDGTRLDKSQRDELDSYHRQELNSRGIAFVVVEGSWEERYQKAIAIIDTFISTASFC